MPRDIETNFKKWWRSLPPSTLVDVQFPHEKHGNSGKVANSAKTSIMEEFLEFVDNNSQPNGQSADCTGPTFYFLPKFSTIQMPKAGVGNYETRILRSLVGEFNHLQSEAGKDGYSNASSHNWLKNIDQSTQYALIKKTIVTSVQKSKGVFLHSKQL